MDLMAASTSAFISLDLDSRSISSGRSGDGDRLRCPIFLLHDSSMSRRDRSRISSH